MRDSQQAQDSSPYSQQQLKKSWPKVIQDLITDILMNLESFSILLMWKQKIKKIQVKNFFLDMMDYIQKKQKEKD